MLLPWLILIPFIGGFLCWQTERFGVKVPRWIALITMGLTLALSLQLWLQGGYSLTQSAGIPQWQSEFDMRGSRVLVSLFISPLTVCRC